MGALAGLGVGIGLLLIWSAFALPRRPRQRPRTPGRLTRLLGRAGLAEVSPRAFVAVCVACAGIVGVAVQATTRAVPVVVVFAAAGGYLPVAVVIARGRRRQRDFAEVWPEAVDNLASAVRAGLSLPDGLGALAVRGPQPLREAFAAFALDYQVTGRFGESLDRLKDRLADPVGDRVVEGLRVAREVGGGELGRLLRNLSGYLREEMRTRSELEARQSWAVNGARLAVAAPWAVLLLMTRQPEVIERFTTTPGVAILVTGAAASVLAYRVMMRIGRLPVERRILA